MHRQDFPLRGHRHRALLDQQLWYLGQDIRAASGNALTSFGFIKARDWFGASGSGSSYVLPLAQPPNIVCDGTRCAIICWGFGIYIGQVAGRSGHVPSPRWQGESAPGWSGVLMERFQVRPRLVRHPIAHHIGTTCGLPATCTPALHDERAFVDASITRLAQAMAGYERWAIATIGDAHRQRALESAPRHKRRRFVTLPHLAGVWDAWRTPASQHTSSRQGVQ